MKSVDVDELHNDLMRRAEAFAAAAEESAINGDTSDARRDDGKATAYRHAAELLRAAEDRAVRAAAGRVAR
jgi:hypothetical protein